MSKVFNLDTSTGKNIIGDDTLPTLTLEGTSSGEILKLQNAGGTGVQLSQVSCPTTAQMIRGVTAGVDAYVGKTAGLFNSTGGFGVAVTSCPTTAVYVLGKAVGGYFRSAASEAVAIVADRSVIGSVTVAVVKISQLSTPSGAMIEFAGVGSGIVSTASGTPTLSYGVRVKIGDSYGWIPVLSTIA